MGQVSAVDLDLPPYDAFTYRLQRDDPDSVYFRLDGATGSIRTTTTLDRERRRMYRMSVVAQSDTVRQNSSLSDNIQNVVTSSPGPVRSIVMSMSVCLSVRSRKSKTTRPNFTKFCASCL